MIALDTNALIYRALDEKDNNSPEIVSLIRQAKGKFNELYGKHEKLAIPLPVLIEFANFLKNKFGRQKAQETLDRLISDENFKIIEAKEEFIHMAASIAEEQNADFTDSLIFTIMYANNIKKILTYDKDFEKFPGIEIIR
ncbi:MAG: type II toxin-antitoxin system VapC family toxin [Candidatus Micrarchaeota archaeon]